MREKNQKAAVVGNAPASRACNAFTDFDLQWFRGGARVTNVVKAPISESMYDFYSWCWSCSFKWDDVVHHAEKYDEGAVCKIEYASVCAVWEKKINHDTVVHLVTED